MQCKVHSVSCLLLGSDGISALAGARISAAAEGTPREFGGGKGCWFVNSQVLLTCMGAVADPVPSHTGLTSPLLSFYYHF